MRLGLVGGARTAFLAAAWPLGGKEEPCVALGQHAADGADREFDPAFFAGDLRLCCLVVVLMMRDNDVTVFMAGGVVVGGVLWTLTLRR